MLDSERIPAALALIDKGNSKILGVTVGSHKVEPGHYIPRVDSHSTPELAFDVPSPTSTYIALCLDLDAPFISCSCLSPILHWMQAGLKAVPSGSGPASLQSSEPAIASYHGAGPPPGAAPHRYVFFLYEQPADFDAKKYAPADGEEFPRMKRMRWDLDAWAEEVKLGPVLAANYFTSN